MFWQTIPGHIKETRVRALKGPRLHYPGSYTGYCGNQPVFCQMEMSRNPRFWARLSNAPSALDKNGEVVGQDGLRE